MGRYAELFHGAGEQPAVASPLGAWLVLALAGTAARGDLRDRLQDALGCTVDDAAAAAGTLLADPHPLVAAACAAWWRSAPDLDAWAATLPAAVERGPVPSQPVADAWARDRTFGLVERFPLHLRDAVLVLASALATKVSWETPYEVVPATGLGADSPFGRQVRAALAPGAHFAGGQCIAPTERAGDVAAHWAWARDGLAVVSVAAAPDVPPADVLAAAHALAPAVVGRAVPRRALADLPLGAGPAWTLTEEPAGGGPPETCTAVLPAWSAQAERDLTSDPRWGFVAAGEALRAIALPGGRVEARQRAVARYTREGFEAAAVTGIAVLAALARYSGPRRVAELRFGHPYAVVAVASGGAWDRLPVFSAWVTEPSEAV